MVSCIKRRVECTGFSEESHNFGSVRPFSKAKRDTGVNFDMHVKVYIEAPPESLWLGFWLVSECCKDFINGHYAEA